MLAQQMGLFGHKRPEVDARFRALRHIQLDESAWVDQVPGWVTGHEPLMDVLVRTTRWRSERREMYERTVDVPRLLITTVSLGEPRRFLLKRNEGGPSMALSLGWGDLIVMGGSGQRTWKHGIPKTANAGPRLVVMFRPGWYRED
jgi:alkylated DNA repair dioxygenase AlkB